MPVSDRVAGDAADAGTLEDRHVVGAVVADHRGHNAARGHFLDRDVTLTLEAHRLFADVFPGGGADAAVALHQLHVFGETRIESLIHEVPDAVDVGVRVVAELRRRVVPVVDRGGQVNVAVTQTGGAQVLLLDQATPLAGVRGLDRAFALRVAAAHQALQGHRAEGAQQRHRQRRRAGFVAGRPLDEAAPAHAGGGVVDRTIQRVCARRKRSQNLSGFEGGLTAARHSLAQPGVAGRVADTLLHAFHDLVVGLREPLLDLLLDQPRRDSGLQGA